MISFRFSIFLAAEKNVKFPVYSKLFTISGKVLSIQEIFGCEQKKDCKKIYKVV